MQTKRLFSFMCVLIIVAMLLSACGTPATPAPAQPTQPAQPAQPAQPEQPAQPAQPESTTAPEQPSQPAQPAQPEPKKSYKIGFLAGVQDPFYFTMQRGAQQAAADLGLELVVQIPPKWNVTDQTPMLDAMVARGDLDALFLAPVDKEGMIAPLQKANESGLPIITVDTFIGDGDYVNGPITFPLSFIASDNELGGEI
ncbi:partial Ribose import binding protein RbsB, partial [Thermoflexales bacterium]